MDFAGRRAPLSRTGLQLGVETLGLGVEGATCLWGVIDVETGGTTQGYGFRSDGRPQILYERHKFREFTGGRFDDHPQVSGPRGGYGSLADQYKKLDAAVAHSTPLGHLPPGQRAAVRRARPGQSARAGSASWSHAPGGRRS